MFCPKCGSQNVDTNKFCKKCGKNLPVRAGMSQSLSQNFVAQHSPSFLGQVLDGKYKIDAKLGSGGMGDVYRATRLLIGDVVAIKILHPHLARDPQAAERFRREAVTATKLRHRNVVGLYDVGISAAHNVPYILMELAEGFTLRQIINQYRVLPLDFAVTVTTQVCSALDEAHGLGIVHRDIKPENIVANQTTTGWYIKVLDFGIAKLYNQGDIGLTQDGSAMGTPQYMSPEQCMGESLDARSDIYSVGIMLYEMLTGTVPFKSPTASAIAIHQVQTAPQPLRTINTEIHPAVEAVVLKSLEKQREPRQQKASQLAQELIQAATVAFKSGFTAVPAAPIPAPDVVPEFEASAVEDSTAATTLVIADLDAVDSPKTEKKTRKPRSKKMTEIDNAIDRPTKSISGMLSTPPPVLIPEEPLVEVNEVETDASLVTLNEARSESALAEINEGQPNAQLVEVNEFASDEPMVKVSEAEPVAQIEEVNAAEPDAPFIEVNEAEAETPLVEVNDSESDASPLDTNKAEADVPMVEGCEAEYDTPLAEPPVFANTAVETTAPTAVYEHLAQFEDSVTEHTAPRDFDDDMTLVFEDAELRLDEVLSIESPSAIEEPIPVAAETVLTAASPVSSLDSGDDRATGHPDSDSAPTFGIAAETRGKSSKMLILAIAGACVLLVGTIGLIADLAYRFIGPVSGGETQTTDTSTGGAPSSTTVPAGMAFVPGGEFMMGSDTGHKDSQPAHKVTVKPFYMDITEVTNEEYKKFVDGANYTPPPDWKNGTFPNGKAKFPVTGVNWDDANAYAAWAGKRLPSEEEWEFAARGTDGRIYPWGNNWGQGLANAGNNAKGHHGMAEVGEHTGKSPFGMLDMVGNAWEWTASEFVAYPGGKELKDASGKKVIRGGCYLSKKDVATTTYRFAWLARGAKNYNESSFRCVKDSPTVSQ